MLKLSWMISLGITLVGFLIIEYFFSYTPDSGNGNLGFVGVTLIFPFLLLSLFITFRYFLMIIRTSTNRFSIIYSIIFGSLILFASIYFAIDYKNNILDATGEQNLSLFTLTNETSRIYFNVYTFIFLHTVCGMIGVIVGTFSQNKKAETL